MEPGAKQSRIQLSIRMRSQALSRFIEKALQEHAFFQAAIDDPLTALRESGVRLDLTRFAPSDLATFLGALAAVRTLVEKRQIKEISFERIFGQPAEVLGTTITAQTHRGMWTQFNRDAFVDQGRFTSTHTTFESLAELRAELLADQKLSTLAELDVRGGIVRDRQTFVSLRVEGVGESVQSRETDHGVTFHFDADKGIGSSSSSKSDTYSTKSFAGVSPLEQLLEGPMISPADLHAVAAQLETYVRIAEQAGEV